MRKRKIKKRNPEKSKLISFQIGMILALLIVLYAFEYKSYDKYISPPDIYDRLDIPEEIVLPTVHKKKKSPPVPKINIIISESSEIDADIIEIDVSSEESEGIPPWEPSFDPEPELADDIPLIMAEEQPSFPGGYAEMMKFIRNNIEYPHWARETNISGIVYLQFVVEKDGSLTNITIFRGIGGGCDEEAVRVVSMMDNWNSGKQNGIPVRVLMTLPIKFSLL